MISDKRTPHIFVVTITTFKDMPKGTTETYTRERRSIFRDVKDTSAVFLTMDKAMEYIRNHVWYCSGDSEYRTFRLRIDEHEEGADITGGLPERSWHYDREGRLIKKLVRMFGSLEHESGGQPHQIGDIVEYPTSDLTVQTGIIARVPLCRDDFTEYCRSHPGITDDECHSLLNYTIVTGPDPKDFEFCRTEDFMPYVGSAESMDFMDGFLEQYKKRYGMKEEYGLGINPPYSLYQDDSGKWGLVDGDGNRLPSIFHRIDDSRFSSVTWEVVEFDEKKGFGNLELHDPLQIWFGFTFYNPAYPPDFAVYLWQQPEERSRSFADTVRMLMPADSHWLVDYILEADDFNPLDERAFCKAMEAMLLLHPEIQDAALTNPLLDPVMRNAGVAHDVKAALWRAKVMLDSTVRIYLDDYQGQIQL